MTTLEIKKESLFDKCRPDDQFLVDSRNDRRCYEQ